jgi:hypothetical protein
VADARLVSLCVPWISDFVLAKSIKGVATMLRSLKLMIVGCSFKGGESPRRSIKGVFEAAGAAAMDFVFAEIRTPIYQSCLIHLSSNNESGTLYLPKKYLREAYLESVQWRCNQTLDASAFPAVFLQSFLILWGSRTHIFYSTVLVCPKVDQVSRKIQ